jgi:hypothetical protein
MTMPDFAISTPILDWPILNLDRVDGKAGAFGSPPGPFLVAPLYQSCFETSEPGANVAKLG